jgi:predicted nucleotidyltransferase
VEAADATRARAERAQGADRPRVEEVVSRLYDLARKAPVDLLYLHGSHAQGTQGPLSDLDLAVLLEPDAARSREAVLELLE